MEPILIDIRDYVHAGEGANGESLNHRSDPEIMIKLYNASAPYEIIESELIQAQKVYNAGIPTPKPGEFITDGNGRYGIRFQRIPGKKSFSRATSDNPEKVEEYARDFASMCLKLHSTHLEKGLFPDIKEVDLGMLAANPFFDAGQKKILERFILSVPDADTAIHGDLQYSNAIMAGDKRYFIDLGDFACGNPLFDLGQVLLCCKYSAPEFILETFHLDVKTAADFWYWFAKGYFGDDCNPDSVEQELKPFSGLMVLLIERNANVRFPEFHALLEDTVLK